MILDTIVARKKEEVAYLQKNGIKLPELFLDQQVEPPRGFRDALLMFPGVSIIAEAKKASPSKGLISADFDVAKVVAHYEKSGAQAISVLTDVDFFQGSLENLLIARKSMKLPVIRKDFIIDEIQIEEASLYGADAILLIAAILDVHQIQDYFSMAKELGMDVLTEVHSEAELEGVLKTSCDLIGVNNRDLNDFSVDINTTFRLKRMIPNDLPVVSESGLKTVEDMKRLLENDICGALIGETLMRAGTDSSVLRTLRGNGRA